MAEEAKKLTTEEIVVSNVCVTETPTTAVVEKEAPPHPELEAEKVEKPAAEEVVDGEKEATTVEDDKELEAEKVEKSAAEEVVDGEKEATTIEDDKIAESASFKEESNKVDDLIDPQKKALDEFKQLIQEALNKHEFTAPPPAKEEESKPKEMKEEESKPEEKKEETCEETPVEVPPPVEPFKEEAPVEKKWVITILPLYIGRKNHFCI